MDDESVREFMERAEVTGVQRSESRLHSRYMAPNLENESESLAQGDQTARADLKR